MCSSCEFRKLRKEIKKGFKKMSQQVTDFAAAAIAAFSQINSALDNIVADEAALAAQIQDLKNQIANSNSFLSPEDAQSLDAILQVATALAARSKATADDVPDFPTPPTV